MPPRALLVAACLVALTVNAFAQSTTGTISGRVTDSQGLSLPGVTVTAASPNLQGTRETVTSENGDYLLSLLPPGTYTVVYELSGFQRHQRSVNLAPTQVQPIDVSLGVAGLVEAVQVVGRTADVLTQTAQVATNFSSDLIGKLPNTRNLEAYLLLAPAAHPTGPGGNWSIAGSMSFENLFLINGVTVNENLRGQANTLFIEDAIQEATVATAGISAEYGRFGGGVMNVITKSGGNLFTGSFRDTLHNDDWRALVPKRAGDPFANDRKLDQIVPTYEYTFGGPILRDKVWFFTAGRFQKQEFSRQLVQTNHPYVATNKIRRLEFNSTYSPNASHRVQGNYIREDVDQLNDTFDVSNSMDLNSLYDRSLPQDLTTFSYSGVLASNLFVEARGSKRNFTFVGSGAKTTDLIDGTLLIDRARGNMRYWAATFCGVCDPEERDNENFFVKGNYFLSGRGGSHSIVAGYDNFNDVRKANNRQSGSDYRIIGTTSVIRGPNDIVPVFLNDGSTVIQWNPIPVLSKGSNYRTHAVFFNDSWRVTDRLTANLGVRYDKNDGKNQAGETVLRDSAWSPRLGVIYDPTGEGQWSVTGSVSRYVAGVANSVADSSSKAGNSQAYQWTYRGPNINPGGVVTTSTQDALRQLFSWLETTGGCPAGQGRDDSCVPNLPLVAVNIPGVATRIGDNLITPNNWEYAAGVNRNFGARAAVRVDYSFRDFRDFYVAKTDTSTGIVTNAFGQRFDLTYIINSNVYERKYQGVTTQGTYRFGTRTDAGATYTLSRTWGSFDGETFAGGPGAGSALQYPEFKQARWNFPEGDLAVDQRHRARLWLNYGVPRVSGLTLSVMQTLESGVPYGASSASGVNPRPFVADPGYATPPSGTNTTYFFTDRDAFRAEGQKRTDFAANYNYDINAGSRRVGLFVQAQVINLFNQFQLCGCGATVFANGGASQVRFIDQTVRTAVTHSALYRTFNPFTETPVQGTHWDLGPNFGKALSRFAYTTPRMLRVTFGVRF